MKLGKTSWLILGAGILVIAAVALYMVYHEQVRERRQLSDSLAAAQHTFLAAGSEQGAQQRQLAHLEGELARLADTVIQAEYLLAHTKGTFPEAVGSIEYGEILFNLADDYRLILTSLTASEPSDQMVDGVTYSVASYSLHVEGRVADLLDFINRLTRSEHFASAAIGPVSMTIPGPPAEGEEERPASATISIVIYGYYGE
jgi:hypothetical protein